MKREKNPAIGELIEPQVEKVTTSDNWLLLNSRHNGSGYEVRLIRPTFYSKELLPAFLFISPPVNNFCSIHHLEEKVKQLAISSGHIAVVSQTTHNIQNAVFQLFEILLWMADHGGEKGIDRNRLTIVGLRSGANIAAVLSQMALDNCHPKVNAQILVDPQFFTYDLKRIACMSKCPAGSKVDALDWIDFTDIYNIPLTLAIDKLTGLPPTTVQLSRNFGTCIELENYCSRLLHAGNDIIYMNCDETERDTSDMVSSDCICPSTLVYTAAELRKLSR